MHRAIRKKKLKKIAILPIIIGAAAVLAAIWLWSHVDDPDRGLLGNIDNSLKELEDLKTNSWYESNVDATVQSEADNIEKHLQDLRKQVIQFNSIMSQIQRPMAMNELENDPAKLSTVAAKYGADVNAKLESFRQAIEEITPLLAQSIANFSSRQYQLQHTQESWLGDVSGWLGEAFHGRWGLIANDFMSAVNALDTLMESLRDAYRLAGSLETVKQQKQRVAADALASLKNPQFKPKEDSMPEFGESPYGHEEPSFDNMDYSQIASALGYTPNEQELEFFKEIMQQ